MRDVWHGGGSLEEVRAMLLKVFIEGPVELSDVLWGGQCGNLVLLVPCGEASITSEIRRNDVGHALFEASWGELMDEF